MEHSITVVGIGPGNPSCVLPEALQTIKNARILVGSRRALKDFSSVGQQIFPITAVINDVINFIGDAVSKDDVVVMVSGDPGYFSLLDAIKREFPFIPLKVIPGISSLQYAFSRLALPWHDARLLSFHGRIPDADVLQYKKGSLLGLLTDNVFTPVKIAGILIEHGWPAQSKLFVCSRLSYDDEQIVSTTLKEINMAHNLKECVVIVEDI